MVQPYKPIYTAKEVSQILRINIPAVYELMNTGKLPYLKLGSRKIRGTDLERFINDYKTADDEKREAVQEDKQ